MPIRSSQIIWCAVKSDSFIGPQLSQNKINALFASMTGAQNKAGAVDFARVAVRNLHPTLTLSNVRVWFKYINPWGSAVAISLDGAGVVVDPVNNPVSNNGAPVGFSAPTTQASGLSITTFPPGAAFSIWVRRTGMNSIAVPAERNTITLAGTSPA